MPEILLDFPIDASRELVFRAVSTPEGLDRWWTKDASGIPSEGAYYELGFGPEYQWRARVRKYLPNVAVEFEMVVSDSDWAGTRLGFSLDDRQGMTWVRFYHQGWPSTNEHFRVSAHCWSMYLRLMRRYVELGEVVSYDARLSA